MGSILEIPGLLTGITDILKRVIPDPVAAAQAQKDLTQLVLDSEAKKLEASKDVMVADATQEDKFTKRARPAVVYWAMGFATYIAVAGQFGAADKLIVALQAIPTDLWTLMTVGIGAFGVSRAVEKGLSTVRKK